ncbi:hypothetical protein J6590_055249 [Homalodisca vitripennis]|nr:hypothetical protein J6590_055249 [Homalodisca vitripennis]
MFSNTPEAHASVSGVYGDYSKLDNGEVKSGGARRRSSVGYLTSYSPEGSSSGQLRTTIYEKYLLPELLDLLQPRGKFERSF